jgi:hypothetical protein
LECTFSPCFVVAHGHLWKPGVRPLTPLNPFHDEAKSHMGSLDSHGPIDIPQPLYLPDDGFCFQHANADLWAPNSCNGSNVERTVPVCLCVWPDNGNQQMLHSDKTMPAYLVLPVLPGQTVQQYGTTRKHCASVHRERQPQKLYAWTTRGVCRLAAPSCGLRPWVVRRDVHSRVRRDVHSRLRPCA